MLKVCLLHDYLQLRSNIDNSHGCSFIFLKPSKMSTEAELLVVISLFRSLVVKTLDQQTQVQAIETRPVDKV